MTSAGVSWSAHPRRESQQQTARLRRFRGLMRLPRGRGSLTKRSMAGDPAIAGNTREEDRLLDGRKRDYEPLAAIKFHVRIRGAPCVGFFSCHLALSFSLGRELVGT